MKINEGTGVLLTLFLQVIYVHVITSCSEHWKRTEYTEEVTSIYTKYE